MILTLLKKTFLFACIFGLITTAEEKKCIGEDPVSLNEDCVILEAKTLVFKANGNVALIKSKLRSVRRIDHGVEVIGTDYENFDFLSEVHEIHNPNGPALTFKENTKLKKLTFDQLKSLKGKEVDILFEKDNFPMVAHDNSESMRDLLHLESIARRSHGREKCSADKFIRIVEAPEASGHGWIFYLLIVLGVLLVVGLGVQGFFMFRSNSKEGTKDPSGKSGKSGKKGKKGDKKENTTGPGEKPPSSENATSAGKTKSMEKAAVKENPKSK